ncbi:MAG: copper-binding protein [Acidobacteriota bacterium]
MRALMNGRKGMPQGGAVVLLGLVLALSPACARQPAKKSYAFRGHVEQVDAAAKTLSVNNENIPGWMMAMTMTYGADKADTFGRVKAGDDITATVYEGDFKTLYDVQVVQKPAAAAAPAGH